MTIQETIKKAIEGGYSGYSNKELDEVEYEKKFENVVIDNYKFDFHILVLDPLFWQSLGKSLGWPDNPTEVWQNDKKTYYWEVQWHRFIDHLAENKSIESFFEELN